VKSGAFLHRAIVHDHAYVGSATSLRGCVLGRNADVKHAARLEEGVVVGDESDIGEGAVLNPQVKVYPFKSVENGALVTKSIIWESRGSRALFGDRGVSGLVNIDVTPESAVRLAMAFASTLPKRSVIVAARDGSTTARVIKRAMVAGANAAGTHVHDLELVPPAVARFYARSARANSGFVVRESWGDPAAIDSVFFDGRGVDVDLATQRRIERNFHRDELRKVFHHDLGELVFPARGREYYARQMLEVLDAAAIRSRRAKVVLDYGSGAANTTGPLVLGGLGIEVLAVNGTIDPDRAVNSDGQVAEHSRHLADLVRSSGADLGVLLDSAGERAYLVDDAGRELTPGQALLAYVALIARTSSFPRVALPVSTSRVAARIVAEGGGSVAWTRISPAALMDAAESQDVVFAGAEGGGYIFPSFLAAFDGLMSVGKLLELLARTQTSLSAVVDSLPESHIVRRDVPTPWEVKGSVMRLLLEREATDGIDTTDGLKSFRGEDWALVAPHPQEPVIRVWAEAGSPVEATALADEYAALIEELKA
jgi:mannose-1-phosphate guanylyltransferase/phosphomannomutase